MSVLGPRDPIDRLEELVKKAKNGELGGWVFIHRLDRVTQREWDGEPVTTPDVEACMDQVDPEDLRFIARKLLDYAEKSKPNLEKYL